MTEVTQQEIHAGNQRAHNEYVAAHDRLASHIAKRSCRLDYQRRVAELLARHHVSLEGARVLEFGCGTGNWAQYLLGEKIASYTGLDISDGMIAAARAKVSDERARFVCQPVEDFVPAQPGPSGFQLIFSFSFVHHLYDLPAYFQRIHSLLAPGGLYLAMHEPFCRQLDSERRNLGEVLDNLAAVLMGWDMPRQSVFRRLGQIGGALFSRFRRRPAPALDSPPETVDYQLSRADFNHATVQSTATKQGLDAQAVLYSYYRFRLIRAFFGSMKNYFAIAARRAP